jgi:pseudouridine kinase
MSKADKISVFGASNVDITGYTKSTLIYKDANIGTMKTTAGGVGRNIAENLKYLEFDVALISIFGDDPLSDFLINDCRKKKINIDKSLFLQDASASTFIAIMDEHNDLAVGISAMNLYDELPEKTFIDKLPENLLGNYTVLETNFSTRILQAVIKKYPGKKFVLDTVSGKKALRAIPLLKNLYILKTNLLEAKMMSEMKIKNDSDLFKLTQYFIDMGVEKVFITLGKDGVIYGNKDGIYKKKSIASKITNTIGAGDSFVAGLIYADAQNKNIHELAQYGMAAAAITVQHTEAVNPEISPQQLKKIIDNARIY